MTHDPRLIEVAFPLRQTSLDSVHEKNVRHGHISTLHIWPARRPLAACRAALLATLLPDPGNEEERRKLLEKIGGTLKPRIAKRKVGKGTVEEVVGEETEGGVLHWGRENAPDMDSFRAQIRAAYGGRAPKVLDPFAGGGAIPLEAMRLGCDVTAIDINPVAWFILKCTLEYPQRLAGQTHPLPDYVRHNRDFVERFLKAQGFTGNALHAQLEQLGLSDGASAPTVLEGFGSETARLDADLAWHVRAWGTWVLHRARADLERFYPVVDGKPTVAYLWARTVRCKNCRATMPLLKTRWLVKKANKRVALTMEPDATRSGVVFGIQHNVPPGREREIAQGTMSRKGAWCPCCGKPGTVTMTSEDLRYEAQAGRMGAAMTAVVVDGKTGKEYRLPTPAEMQAAVDAAHELDNLFAEIPFGLPEEPVPKGGSRVGGGSPFTVHLYGLTRWRDLFTPRQLLVLGTFVKHTRAARDAMSECGYSDNWIDAIRSYLALAIDRIGERNSTSCHYDISRDSISGTFQRYALSINWDFAEAIPTGVVAGSYEGQLDWIVRYVEHALDAAQGYTNIINHSATQGMMTNTDVIITDPPYYDAIPYSDLMDFFYVWLRRTICGLSPEIDTTFREPLAPKWNHETNDGELIDDASRFEGDKQLSKAAYEDGMFRAFQACYQALNPDGRLVIVFAHKHPDAWETLVSAIIRAGFIVVGSWPIATEMSNRTRALSSAALASSIWLVCKKRPAKVRPGWDTTVLEQMHERIRERLTAFWDMGIRGPDFVWSAAGPALEAYSRFPAVRKANIPDEVLTVSEFLRHVRRMVVDFVVGRVLSQNGHTEDVSALDDVTTYYLLHRHDFGMEDAPVGAVILYAISCNLSDRALIDQYDLMGSGRKAASPPPDDGDSSNEESGDTEPATATTSSSSVRLKPWQQRTRKSLGEQAPSGQAVPLIDQVHRLMHVWKAGDVTAVDAYIDARGLRRNGLFHQVLQSLIELATAGSDERALLESISNHLGARGVAAPGKQERMEM